MAETEKIFGAIIGVMEDVGAVGKDQKNTKQNYKYRGIDDVMNALHPALVKNKIFILPNVLDVKREERKGANGNNLIYTIVEVNYSFTSGEDSSSQMVHIFGEAMDSGDKSLNKALSAAYKYACFQLFSIPTEEMKDSEEDTYMVGDGPITAREAEILRNEFKRVGRDADNDFAKMGKKVEDLTKTKWTKYLIDMAKRPDCQKAVQEAGEHNAHSSEDRESGREKR